ncbi:MAG: methyltransferase domain-containing protein [Nitrospirae bacterium]|nr:MAG: methyltransferase domain-containing protein [Nitrospirota bacterium]
MKESLLQYLVCPTCRESLAMTVAQRDEQEIEEGRLQCGHCKRSYPILKGIPRFVETDAYVGSFSFQWNVHRKTQVDSLSGHAESHKTFETKTGFTGSDLAGKLTLDVGCGTGRFMEVAADAGAEVIGLDLSYAVDAAYANMGRRRGIHIIQADVFKPPFRPATFDAIYSIGVLHHTPSTREAFLALTPLLKPNGVIAIWVYVWAGEYSKRLDRVRKLTVGLPERLLYGLCWVVVPMLHFLAKVPLLGRAAYHVPTSNQGRGLAWDVMDTFDVYAPRYQWKHEEPEVMGWFKEAMLESVSALSFPVSVRGRKPAA